MIKMNKIIGVSLIAVILTLTSGCALFKDKLTGKIDPLKLQQVSDMITPVASSVVTRVVKKNPETGKYFESVSRIFCSMRDSKNFKIEFLVQETDILTRPYLNNQDLIDGKNIIIALYRTYLHQVGNADVSEDVFLLALSNFFCNAIGQGLTDTGYVLRP